MNIIILAAFILIRTSFREIQAQNTTQFCDFEGSSDSNPITIPWNWTATDQDPEHLLAYFREDYGLNYFHWHWHLNYPFEGPLSAVNKSRRGELFYYVHEQFTARQNFERFSNKLQTSRSLDNWSQPIPEAYFPKLNVTVASLNWPGRPANLTLQNVNRDGEFFTISDMMKYRKRIEEAIRALQVIGENGKPIKLTSTNGIDILGNLIESSIISVNRTFYGNLHNDGHLAIGYVHDPSYINLEPAGVMTNNATAIRDPLFYPWHTFVNNLFQSFLERLPAYSEKELTYPGVVIDDVSICSDNDCQDTIYTFWENIKVNLSRSLDLQRVMPRIFNLTILQHQPFNYKIKVTSKEARKGVCRIFLSSKFDDEGKPWTFNKQRIMFIELDRFNVELIQGSNTINRSSQDSSVTIPFNRTYRDLDSGRPTGGDALSEFIFCGCGYPQNLLIPRGTPQGFPSKLFVMISDDQLTADSSGPCNDAYSYCGIRNQLYPDSRHMGYPFDRVARKGVSTLEEFLTSNMRVADISIRLTGNDHY